MLSEQRSVVTRMIAFIPVILFVVLPLLLLMLYIFCPQLTLVIFVVGAILAGGFFYYILKYRRENTPFFGASIPTVFGNLITFWFIRVTGAAELDIAIQKGGGELIQLAFFFAGVINLCTSIYQKLGEPSGDWGEKILLKVSFLLFVFFVIMIIGYQENFAPPQPISVIDSDFLEWLKPHGYSPLFLCRTMLTLYAILVATWPRNLSRILSKE